MDGSNSGLRRPGAGSITCGTKVHTEFRSFCVLKKFWVLLLKVLTMSSVPGGPVCDWIFEKVPHLEPEVYCGWFCLAQVSF